ncbi:phage major capsid protein, HK97 family [Methylobacterium nodulans ORS 2060]|uniref:Phage major capsid protein, HK97 family n=2 Tax=Methylobacterium nodulans TaxID=114616 RepID=B8IT99_METNO|nr:phage major capsid protein, HK97 family [Methylobacterium nodulans ORS 2060]
MAALEAPLRALQEKRAGIVARMREILQAAEAEDRDLTAEEAESYDGLKADKDALDRRIARLEEQAGHEAALEETRPAVSRRAGPQPVRRHGEASTQFESLGEFMHAVRFRPNDQRLDFHEGIGASEAEGALSAEMRMDDGPSGGFAIPPQFRTELMSVRPQDSIVRSRANVLPAGSPPDAPVVIPALDQTGDAPQGMFGGVKVTWIEEGGEKPETDLKLREIMLTPHEVAGTITIGDKLLRNWQTSDTLLRTQLRGAVSAAEDYAFLRGNGVGRPLGAIHAPAAYKVPRAQATKVTYVDLVTMLSRLLMRGSNPVWSAPQAVLPQIMLLKDDQGRLIWQPNAQDGIPGTLLGYPLIWNNRAPLLGTLGDVVLADWSSYLIKDGSGPYVAASEHVHFTRNKTVIKVFWNVDGAPWLTEPIKEENGYAVSPFVVLDVPAA